MARAAKNAAAAPSSLLAQDQQIKRVIFQFQSQVPDDDAIRVVHSSRRLNKFWKAIGRQQTVFCVIYVKRKIICPKGLVCARRILCIMLGKAITVSYVMFNPRPMRWEKIGKSQIFKSAIRVAGRSLGAAFLLLASGAQAQNLFDAPFNRSTHQLTTGQVQSTFASGLNLPGGLSPYLGSPFNLRIVECEETVGHNPEVSLPATLDFCPFGIRSAR